VKLTVARSGIARSGATRSGWPVLLGTKVKLYAISKIARSGATRSNYTGHDTFISVGGIHVGTIRPGPGIGVLIDSLTISDSLSSTPTTGTMTARGWVPVEGADVVITLGSKNNASRAFGGTILKTLHRYVGDRPVAANMLYDCTLIDYSWGLQRRKVSGRFTATTVGAIAASLMTAAPVGYTLQVAADIAAARIDEITITETNLDDAFGQLVTRVGGDWQCDYAKVVRLFFTDTASAPPSNVNAVHKSMAGITWDRDLSQVVTRVYVDAGGSDALEAIQPGETMIPVDTAVWYPSTGGTVLAGPQRVQYSGVDLGGTGSLVGPGAAPTSALNALVVPGSGVTAGAHGYAVTYQTAAGETIPSPVASVQVGVFAPPAAAPVAGPPTSAGPGPDLGAHDYAVTFMVSTGETTPGPRVTGTTDVTPPPTVGPNVTLGAEGAGPDFGTHDYAVSFVTAAGETTPGPIGGSATTGNAPINPPATGPTIGAATAGGAIEYGSHAYGVAFVTAYGETTMGPWNQVTIGALGVPAPTRGPDLAVSNTSGGGSLTPGATVYYEMTYVTANGETPPGPNAMITTVHLPPNPNYSWNTNVTAYGSTDARCTQVNIYRNSSINGQVVIAGQWMFAGSVPNNPTGGPCQVFSDGYYPAGAAPPSINTTDPNRTIPLSNIPRGSSNVIARKVYRSIANTLAMHLLVTLNDNTTTTYTDNKSDAALGAGAQGSNTALGTVALALDSIPKGSAAVTARKLYRRSGGVGLRYLDTIANNVSTTYTDTKTNAALGAAPPSTTSAYLQQIPLSALPIGGSVVTARKLYRTKIGNSGLFLLATLDNVVTTYLDTTPDASLGAAAPTTNAATAAQVNLSAIPVGASTVTARRLYRTAANLAQLRLLTTIADNVATTWVDTAADAALGVNAPTSDTSTLTQPQGIVLAGSPTLPCASVAAFAAAGGWAIAGSQAIRYTGITGNTLTGLRASGPGSITSPLTYNTTILAAATIRGIPANGVGAIRVAIVKGDPVDLFIQEDDVAAQTALAAQLGGGADGIVEDEIQDRRLSATEAHARGRARLAQLAERDADGKVGIVTVRYTCRDINTRAGATVAINLGAPINLRGDFLIQRVTINAFGSPHVPPTYTVEASSVRFTFEELLRVIREAAA
jgi:hypothetical protein